MNNLNSNHREEVREAADQALRDDLAALYRLPVPDLAYQPAAQVETFRPPRRWRPALFSGAAAAGLLLFVAGSAVLDGGTPEVSAETIFERTKQVTATASLPLPDESYHLVARSETSIAGAQTTVSETWYLDPEHQRTEVRDAASGRILWGSARDGDDMWMYSEVDGRLTAVHSRVGETAFAFAIGGFGVPGVTSLADLLESFTNECSDAMSAGEDVIAGRPVYVIDVVSKPETCKFEAIRVTASEGGEVKIGEGGVVEAGTVNVEGMPGEPLTPSVSVHSEAAVGHGEMQVVTVLGGPMRMWIDQETFMTLKSESNFGDSGSHTYDVTALELGDGAMTGDFAFAPPADAEIIEADSPQDANGILKGMFLPAFSGGVKVEGSSSQPEP